MARAITDIEGPDYITTFESGDGEKAYSESKLDLSFKEGVNIKDVFSTTDYIAGTDRQGYFLA